MPDKLKQYFTSFRNPDAAKKDVMNVLHQYKNLIVKQENFVYNDGSSAELVNLSGTIPVPYKGSVYNIPLCIWLTDHYPAHAPFCFVKPTQDMFIKVSRHVDHNGRVYLPYLHEWVAPDSSLLGLVRVLCTVFGQMPPVYSKPRAEQQNMPPYPTNSMMPQPGGGGGYPPYPSPSTTTPYPPYAHQPSGGLPYPTYSPFPSMPQPQPQYPPSTIQGVTPYQPSNEVTSGGTITEEHIKVSLLSAVEDKLKGRIREQFSQNQAELETLRRTQQELEEGKRKLDDIVGKLKREEGELDRNLGVLEEKLQELEESVGKLENHESVDVDEAVMTTAPLYSQLLKAFAEEATTEDTIYYLGEALRASTIDLDVFLKQVRSLSRKQFTLRALMQKCRQKAGLAY